MIDLRSDTVTKPSAAMRKAMSEAKLGDDVFGEDPTVNVLEHTAAEILGTESAIYVCSGTQSNLLSLFSHCQRGDEYIAGQLSHIYCEEGGGGAVLASVQPQPVDNEPDGTLSLKNIQQAIKDNRDFHFAKTQLICLENTMYGNVLPLDYLASVNAIANENHLKMHLDGARLFNAKVELDVDVKAITHHFDSVSVCLSKGLGAPVGSLLCGSKELIDSARRWRKVVGGAMRQAGVIASAGLYAITHHIDRLADDHENAAFLAKALECIDEIEVLSTATNMVFINIKSVDHQLFADHLAKSGVYILPEKNIRLVTHLDVNRDDISKAVECMKQFFVD